MKRSNLIKCLALTTVFSSILVSCDDDNDDNQGPISTYLFASNNSNGNITSYDVSNLSSITSKTLMTTSTAADGIYYDKDNDVVVQASRSSFGLEGFSNASLATDGTAISIGISGTADMFNPREVAVNGNFYVVADSQDVDGDVTTPDGRFFIYSKTGNSFTLRNIITTDFKLWGMVFDGNDLYAVVDATGKLAIFTNFLSNTTNASVAASKIITIEGIVRTHGITYDAMNDMMVLTDIADATNTQDDGGFQIIENFKSKFTSTANGGTLALSQQTRVSGSSTLLGNPVDVAYDNATETVYIAEAGNGGGRILAFNNIGSGGNIAPVVNNSLAAASSVYLSK
ncbi:hypothetical protein [Confluentibacter citreus]|uniref:hypothetical protein n=1 Tax=Confluentibacter citreus TaxID=2007307 RepID=UPI000C28263F|nr:hypothetical protein [Confluentibacter citreus]